MIDDDPKTYTFEAELIHETEEAYLLEVDSNRVWFPKSQIKNDGLDWWTVPEWLAIEKEIV